MDKKKKIIAIVVPIVVILLALIIVLCLVLPKKNEDKCANGHTYTYTDLNADKHTKACNVCGKVSIEETHRYENSTATQCLDCGHQRTVHSHTYQYTDKDDTNHTKKCSGCNEINVTEAHRYASATATQCTDCGHHRHIDKYTQKDATNHIKGCTGCNEISVTEAHRYDSATKPVVDLTQPVVCDDCGYSHTHTPQYVKTEDASKHNVTCSCGLTFQPAPHTYDGENDADCNDCGYVRVLHTTHTYKYEKIDDTQHKVTCTGCDKVNFEEPHKYDSDTDTTCLCGYVRTLHPTEHIYVYTDSQDGVHHTVTCSFNGCNYNEKKLHEYDDDTDTTCNKCNYVRNIEAPHQHSFVYTDVDATNHKKSCETCQEIKDVTEPHTNTDGKCVCGHFFAPPSGVAVAASKTELAPGDQFTLTFNISTKRTNLNWFAVTLDIGPLVDGDISPELGKNFEFVSHETNLPKTWKDNTCGLFDKSVGCLRISLAYFGKTVPTTTPITVTVTLKVKETATYEGPISFGVSTAHNNNVVFMDSNYETIYDYADGDSSDMENIENRGFTINTIALTIKKKTEVA